MFRWCGSHCSVRGKCTAWGQFHNPKNLSSALAVEAAELLEIFQWRTPEASADIMRNELTAGHVKDEMADVFGYLLRLADLLDVDLVSALDAKIEANAEKYPVGKSRGSALKYDEL